MGGIGANRKDPGIFFYENMKMGLTLIHQTVMSGIQAGIVLLGTVCSYPKFCKTPFVETDLWNGYPEETNAPYGVAKKALMVMLEAYRQQYGLKSVSLIPSNLYGPGDKNDLEKSHVVPAIVKKFMTAKAAGDPYVTLWGTGKATREFLHVRDAADAIVKAVALGGHPDPINVGTGLEISVMDLAMMIRSLSGYRGKVIWDYTMPDGQPRRTLDTYRARNILGWEAKVPLLEGLKELVSEIGG